MNAKELIGGIQLGVRAALAAGVSVILARACNFEYPIYAMVAAVLVTDFAPAKTSKLGWQRIVATVIGATCGAGIRMVIPASSATVGVGILLAMTMCYLLRVPAGARVAGYISGIVVLDHASEPWGYAFFRLIETALGIAIAWMVSLVPRVIRLEESESPDPTKFLP